MMMTRHLMYPAVALLLCCAATLAYGAPRGREGEKQGGRAGAEGRSEGNRGREQPGREGGERAGGKKSLGGAWAETPKGGQAQGRPANTQQGSGAKGAAAGAAAANKNKPPVTGAQGAAAGAAAANKNNPKATGAQGAAAGAAAANKNKPPVTGAQGAAAGAAAANRGNPEVSGAAGAAAGAAAVRNSFHNPGLYGGAWYANHHGAWAPAGWAAGAAWVPTAWSAIAAHCNYVNSTPVSYNYGGNVTYDGSHVLVDGESVGTAEEFGQQAVNLAETAGQAEPSDTDEWLPLGVFALVRNEHQHPQLTVQLAINEHGLLRGNYTDEVTEHTLPIRGSVDPDTQRAAWTVGDNMNSVMEAGLSNLTEGEAKALLHKDGKTELWLLVRLEQPDQGDADVAPADAKE